MRNAFKNKLPHQVVLVYALYFCYYVRTKCKWTTRIRNIRLEIKKKRNQRLRRWR